MASLLLRNTGLRGVLSGGLSGFLWGGDALLLSFVFILIQNSSYEATLAVSALHDGLAALWLMLLLLYRGRLKGFLEILTHPEARWCMLGALLGGPVAMTCYILSIAEVGVAVTTTVTACYPLLGAAFSVVVLRARVESHTWIGLSLCLVGLVVTAYSPDGGADGLFDWDNLFFAGLAAVGWASESVVCAYGMRTDRIDPSTALFIRELTSSLAYLVVLSALPILSGAIGLRILGGVLTSPATMGLLIVTALAGMSSFLAWYTSIDAIGPAKALALNVTYSVWGIGLSALFLGQTPSLSVSLGCLIILFGVCYASLPRRSKLSESK